MFLINSCRSDGEMAYTGDSLLIFTAPQNSADVLVLSGAGSSTYNVPFGIVKQSGSDHDVTLVIDQQKSTAKEGVDYTIAKKTVTLKAGDVAGDFPVKLLESGAVQTGKKIVFTVSSPTLKNASFNQDFTINVSLACPISSFVGSFVNTEAWFYDPGETFDIEEDTVPNQLRIVGFMDDGSDFVLKYNPETFVVTFDTQSTGYFYGQYNAFILIRPATDTTKISSFNPCTRKLTLYMDYWMNGVGGWPNESEVFVGN